MTQKTAYLVLIGLLLITGAASPATATWCPPTDTAVYGVEWNASDPSPTLQWIDANGTTITKPNFDQHILWGNIKRVILCPNGTVIRDINPRGDNLDLSGATGAVMSEIPKFYAKSQNASADGVLKYRWWVSPYNDTGYELFPAFVMRGGTERDYIYVGSYEGVLKVDQTDGDLLLHSYTGEQPWTGYGGSPADGMFKVAFDGGTDAPAIGATVTGNTSGTSGQVVDLYVSSGSWAADDAAGVLYLKQATGSFTDNEPLKISGTTFAAADTPTGNAGLSLTINNAEGYAENNGAGYGSLNIWSYNAVRLLYHIEAGSWASQETTGLGVVSKPGGTGFAGENTGYGSIDSLMAENGTGQGSGSAGYTSVAYHTIENLWGNTWTWITGYTSTNTEYQITKRDGTGSLATHPLVAGSYEVSTDAPLGYDGYVSGYWTSLEYEDLLQYLFIPNSVTGGSYTTYGTDYYYSHNPGTRALLAGGRWYDGRAAGVGGLRAADTASSSGRSIGARLEFCGPTTLAGNAPTANVTRNATAGNAPLAVAFTDASAGAPSWWQWEFGDGTTSTAQHPVHTYDTAGTYTVSLTSYTIYGSDTATTTVTVLDPPTANFTANVTAGNAPLVVNFVDTSTGSPTSWQWDFGDGATSAVQNPTHAYAATGVYTVILTATNAYGADTETKAGYITVDNPPTAAFSASDTTIAPGVAAQFTDTSTGSPTSWSWTFGDGQTSTLQHPTHAYSGTGTYTVSLAVTSAYGSDTETKSAYISVSIPPTASFSASPTSGTAPRTVQFTDSSTDSPTTWQWDFGDGATSTKQSPSHKYQQAGNYTVSLITTNAFGSSTSDTLVVTLTGGLRPKTTRTLAPLDEGPYTHFFASFGGSQQLNETTEGVDWLGVKDALEEPYTAALGSLFFALLFALPFVMQWLRQGSMAIPCVLGIILGSIMLAKAPAEYHIVAVVFVALGVLAVVWGVIKDRV